MRVTSIQFEMADRPKAQNVEHALALLDRVPEADLILLPETGITYTSFQGYFIAGPAEALLLSKVSWASISRLSPSAY